MQDSTRAGMQIRLLYAPRRFSGNGWNPCFFYFIIVLWGKLLLMKEGTERLRSVPHCLPAANECFPTPLSRTFKQGRGEICFWTSCRTKAQPLAAFFFAFFVERSVRPKVLGTPAPKTHRRYKQTAHRSMVKTRSRSEHITCRKAHITCRKAHITCRKAHITQ